MDFAYHRSIAPMMWVFVALASIELVVVHVLVALWWPAFAVMLSLLTLAAILWLAWAIASFRTQPVRIAGEMLVLRVGQLRQVAIPLTNVAGLRTGWTGYDIKARGTLNLALIAWPNVLVELREPVRLGRRTVDAVAHRLDDPVAFAAALAR